MHVLYLSASAFKWEIGLAHTAVHSVGVAVQQVYKQKLEHVFKLKHVIIRQLGLQFKSGVKWGPKSYEAAH